MNFILIHFEVLQTVTLYWAKIEKFILHLYYAPPDAGYYYYYYY